MECFECGAPAAHQHHVIPRSRGGMKTVPLCQRCHDLVHYRTDDAGSLIRDGRLRTKTVSEPTPVDLPVKVAPGPDDAEITESDRRAAELSPSPGWTAQDQANLRVKIRNRPRNF